MARGNSETIVGPHNDCAYHTAYGNLLDAINAKTLGEIPGAAADMRLVRRVNNSIIILDRALEDGARMPSEFAALIEAVRAHLQALADQSGSSSEDKIDCPVKSPELTAAKVGIHELAAEVQRPRKLRPSSA